MNKKKILIFAAASSVLGFGIYALIKAKKSRQSMEKLDYEEAVCPPVESNYHTVANVVEEPNHLDEEMTDEQLKDVTMNEPPIKDDEVNKLPPEAERPTNTRKRRVKKSMEDPTVNTNKKDEN